ncbi:uncharacterized protein Dere_GG17823 [Drosophila erecta]|uniref:DUF4794 domain-containing protein n=1 Tax=Drosophila erecta TaxID=7220 RepID=B3NVW5_DROER|nr:uncharacterized protein Dere_GG17823 [Drosophila erecta]
MKFHIIAFAFLGLAAADVSHLKLGLSVDGGYGLSAASSSAAVVPGGDSSSYQPAEYTAEHLQTAEVIPGGDSSSYQPAEYTPALLATSVPAAIGADTYAPVPAAIGADTYAPEKFIPQEVQEVQEQEQEVVVPGGDSSSYQPAEYTPAYLKESVVAPAAAAAVSGGDSGFYQSAVSQTGYVQSQAKAVVAASAGSFYQNAQPLPIAAYVQAQAPVAIAANTITTPLLQTTYSTSGQETQYASNGGYVY